MFGPSEIPHKDNIPSQATTTVSTITEEKGADQSNFNDIEDKLKEVETAAMVNQNKTRD